MKKRVWGFVLEGHRLKLNASEETGANHYQALSAGQVVGSISHVLPSVRSG